MGFREAVDASQVLSSERGERDLRPSNEQIAGRIVPALHRELREARETERRISVLLALARIGPVEGVDPELPTTLELLIDHLADGNRSVAEHACLGIGVLGAPAGAPVLVALLDDTSRGREVVGRPRVPTALRAYAAYALGLTAERSEMIDVHHYVAQALDRQLGIDHAAVDIHTASTVALGLVPPAGSEQEEELGSRKKSRTGRPSVLARLLELYEDEKRADFVRAHAATSLAVHAAAASEATRSQVVATFARALGPRGRASIPVRQSTLLALGRLGDADASEVDARVRGLLRAAAVEGDASARAFALCSLAEVSARPGQGSEPLAAAVETEGFLLARLVEGKQVLRPWVALALGLFGRELASNGMELSRETQDALIEARRASRSLEGRTALGLGLGLGGGEGGVEPLLDSTDGDDGSYSALSLGFLGRPEAVEPLRELLRSSNHQPLRMKRVAAALALLGDHDLMPELARILAQCECDLSSVTLAYVLGRTGDSRAVGPLLAMLADEQASNRKRAWASRALGSVAARDPLPWNARYTTRINYLAAPETLTTGILQGF